MYGLRGSGRRFMLLLFIAEQSCKRAVICLEVKFRESLVVECLYPIVAKIADRPLMSVVNFLDGVEFTRFYLQPHFLVGIAERLPSRVRRLTSSTENM